MNTLSEQAALAIVVSAIARCRKMQPKFADGTSQASLLRNRIRALEIAESLLRGEDGGYSPEELQKALPPIASIHSKMSHARIKYDKDSTQYRRFTPTIEAMELCRKLVEAQLERIDRYE